MTGVKRSESPKSPALGTNVSLGLSSNAHHLSQLNLPISTPSSLMQSLTSQTYSNSTPQLSLFESSLPSPSRPDSCNITPHRVSPSSSLHHHPQHHHQHQHHSQQQQQQQQNVHHHHQHHHKNNVNMNEKSSSSEPSGNKYLMAVEGNTGSGGVLSASRTPTSSPASQLTKSNTAATLPSATRSTDLNPDEMTDLEELEQFAKTFKQRRIKLGKCWTLCTVSSLGAHNGRADRVVSGGTAHPHKPLIACKTVLTGKQAPQWWMPTAESVRWHGCLSWAPTSH